MKTSTLRLLLGVSLPLIGTGPSSGEYLGISVDATRISPGPRYVFSVYAEFDNPDDHMIAVAGTPGHPLTIEIIDGTFYQHPLGTDLAPDPALVSQFPSLAHDTFVTIGEKLDTNPDAPTLVPGWPGFGESALVLTNGGWAITPDNPVGDPFGDAFPGDGRVIIGQFSSEDGASVQGIMIVKAFSEGATFQFLEDFVHHYCFETDIDGDGVVGVLDFLEVLTNWGVCPPVCPADVNGDGEVGVRDMLDVFVFWGPCPP